MRTEEPMRTDDTPDLPTTPDDPTPISVPCHTDISVPYLPRAMSRYVAYVTLHLHVIQDCVDALSDHALTLPDPHIQAILAELGRSDGMARVFYASRYASRAHHLPDSHEREREEPL